MNAMKSSPTTDEHRHREARFNVNISRILATGLVLAIGLLLAGVVLTLARPEVEVGHTSFVKGMPAAIVALEPDGFFQAGLLVLLATPVVRVIALLYGYGRRRQWLFAGMSLLVLAVLVLSAFLGLSGS